MDSKLYVGNLPYRISEDELRTLFAKAGVVVSVALIKDRESGRAKGFGFVEMETDEQAQKAIQMFNGYELDGRALRINIAQPRPERTGMPQRPDRPNFERKRRY